jgi:hypothetical protein
MTDSDQEMRRFRCELLATSIRWIDQQLKGGVAGPHRTQLLAQRRAVLNLLVPLLVDQPDATS